MSNEKQTKAFETIKGDLELGAHDTHNHASPNYQLPHKAEQHESESLFSRAKDKLDGLRDWMRGKKIGRKVVGGVLLAAAAPAVGEAIAASNESERQEAVAVGEEFKAVIEPAAEQLADAAMTGYEQSKNDGYLLEDKKDNTKHHLSFRHTFKDGSSYNITATIGEDAEGKPDTSKVQRAELTELNKYQTSMYTFELKDNVMNGEPQWVASGGVHSEGMDPIASTTEYIGSAYQDKDQKVESAKSYAARSDKELTELAKKTEADNDK